MDTGRSVTGPRTDVSRSWEWNLEPAKVGPVQERWRGRCPAVSVRGEAQRWCPAPVGGIAGLGGLPRINLPMAELEGLPLGLSLNAPRGADMQLLRLARRLMPEGAVQPHAVSLDCALGSNASVPEIPRARKPPASCVSSPRARISPMSPLSGSAHASAAPISVPKPVSASPASWLTPISTIGVRRGCRCLRHHAPRNRPQRTQRRPRCSGPWRSARDGR